MNNVGSRAQVMHGNAKKTSGGLTKSQLKYNKQGKIVSKKASALAKKNNRLVKAGYITQKGKFGVSMKGGEKKNEFSVKIKGNKGFMGDMWTRSTLIIDDIQVLIDDNNILSNNTKITQVQLISDKNYSLKKKNRLNIITNNKTYEVAFDTLADKTLCKSLLYTVIHKIREKEKEKAEANKKAKEEELKRQEINRLHEIKIKTNELNERIKKSTRGVLNNNINHSSNDPIIILKEGTFIYTGTKKRPSNNPTNINNINITRPLWAKTLLKNYTNNNIAGIVNIPWNPDNNNLTKSESLIEEQSKKTIDSYARYGVIQKIKLNRDYKFVNLTSENNTVIKKFASRSDPLEQFLTNILEGKENNFDNLLRCYNINLIDRYIRNHIDFIIYKDFYTTKELFLRLLLGCAYGIGIKSDKEQLIYLINLYYIIDLVIDSVIDLVNKYDNEYDNEYDNKYDKKYEETLKEKVKTLLPFLPNNISIFQQNTRNMLIEIIKNKIKYFRYDIPNEYSQLYDDIIKEMYSKKKIIRFSYVFIDNYIVDLLSTEKWYDEDNEIDGYILTEYTLHYHSPFNPFELNKTLFHTELVISTNHLKNLSKYRKMKLNKQNNNFKYKV